MRILQISLQFAPNIGGLETHLSDLLVTLTQKGFNFFVLCYQPLSTKIDWEVYEKKNGAEILRIPWIAGFFYKLVKFPKLEFLYLFPGLFIFTPFIMIFRRPNIVHAHGLIAGAVAIFWGKLFNIKVIISTHSIYSFPRTGMYYSFAKKVFGSAKYILCLSRQSSKEILSLGIKKGKIRQFTYWIDLKKFRRVDRARSKLGWGKNFTVLFVGRLVLEKGIDVLLDSVKHWNRKINLVFIGTGPAEKMIQSAAEEIPSVKFVGKVDQQELPVFYSAADCVIVPSTHEEGFGRVIIESLACSTPVIASNRGAISEALDETVGKLISITSKSIKEEIEYFYRNPLKLKKLAKNTRNFVERRYSESNAKKIIHVYFELS